MHRRHLTDLPLERRERLLKAVRVQRGRVGDRCHDAVRVGAVGLNAEGHLGEVGFRRIGEVLENASCVTNGEWQDTGSRRVQRAGVANPSLAKQPPSPRHHVVAGPARGFVDDEDAVKTGSGPLRISRHRWQRRTENSRR